MAAGIGLALVMTPASTDAMNTAPAALRSQASGVMNTLKQVGGALGLAVMGTAVVTVQHERMNQYANSVGASATDRAHFNSVVAAAHGDPSMLRSLPAANLGALRDSLISAISTAYLIAGVVVARRSSRVGAAATAGGRRRREADVALVWRRQGGEPRCARIARPPTVAVGRHRALAERRAQRGRAAGRARDRGLANDLGLSEREVEVIGLATERRTNCQVGQQLFLTDTSEGAHVSHILTKPGVTNPAQAAAAAYRLGLARSPSH